MNVVPKLALCVLLFASAEAAYANAGVPMIMLVWPAFLAGLLPIIAVEAYIAIRMLDLGTKEAFKLSALANAASTIIGIPVTWIILLVVEMAAAFSVQLASESLPIDLGLNPGLVSILLFPLWAPWLPPISDITVAHLYAAGVILAIPFCLVSIWSEAWVGRKRELGLSPAQIMAWSRRSNVLTYFAMILLGGIATLAHESGAI